MIQKIIFVILFLYCNISIGQVDSTWYSIKNKIVIPFQLSSNLILIDAKLNDVNLKLILDTGSNNNILFSVPIEETLVVNNAIKTKITGLGSNEPVDAIISSNNIFECKDYKNKSFSILVLNQEDVNIINKLGIEINGILGYSFFKDRIVEINYENKKITIHKDNRILKKRKIKKYSKEKINIIDNKPYIEINSKINSTNKNLKLLFDTGLSDGLWLFQKDSLKLPEKNIDDILGFGLSGNVIGKRARVNEVNLSKFLFKDVLVAYPDSLSYSNINIVSNRNGSIGGELLRRFNLLIDYKNSEIYFKQNDNFNNPFNYNMSGIDIEQSGNEMIKEELKLDTGAFALNLNEIVFNNPELRFNYKYTLKPAFIVSFIRINSPAYNVDIRKGDKIISINNNKAHTFTLQNLTDLFQSEDGKKIKMEIERDGKIIEKIFYLKKII